VVELEGGGRFNPRLLLPFHQAVAAADGHDEDREHSGQHCPKNQINQRARNTRLRGGKHHGNKKIADGDNVPHRVRPV